ncbi:MAG: RNA-guided pseudouridylation complex pseudouridine synthase subunit Cbf5 [Methanosarcinaceae archaeon]|nr:RNA-guided pseudouridylation complex pseudouridine synthase subunit Cbf5 [Methanosarcinaceae archaeon]
MNDNNDPNSDTKLKFKLPSEIERELVHRSSATTNPNYGCAPRERSMRDYIEMGVVNLDKTRGPTSHEVAAWVKKIVEVDRAGHSGSLDPKVTGLLPIMLGKATKAISALRLSGKEYVCLMHLHKKVPEADIRRVCEEFTGPIYQMPPVKSAVRRAIRIRTIYYNEVLEIDDAGTSILMRVGCEAGTYMRKLCHDIGLVLGCGAHMQELRRTKTGPFTEETAISLHDLMDAYVFWKEDGDESELRRMILPMEDGLKHIPKIVIRDSAVDAICSGAMLAVPGIVSFNTGIKKGDYAYIFSQKGEAVALCKAAMNIDESLSKNTGIAAVTERVIMDAGTYSRGWKSNKT